jgi:serine/threonine protein kinase/ABC-type branched-subunit amino acid transport system substrate-binding protein
VVPDDPTRIHELPSGQTTAFKASGDPEALVGQLLKGAFRIEGKIGEGGMGVVFRATQVNLGRPVAVKVIHVGSRIPANAVDRFFREVRLLSQLHHPNVVHVIDFGTEPGPLHFMVMEYLSGESLDHFVESRPRLSPELVLDLMEQICSGMTATHSANVVHRDLKPSNLFVCNVTGSVRPVVKILDFGLGKRLPEEGEKQEANITREGVMMGTCGYSAPEQLHGGDVDERADVYSLGAVLYFLIAGRPPYRDEGFRSTLVKQLTHLPDPIEPHPEWPHLPAVEAVIHKAMSVRPDQRHATPTELFADLTAALRPGETSPGGLATGTRHAAATRTQSASTIVQGRVLSDAPGARRRSAWILALSLALVALLGGVLTYKLTQPGEKKRPASLAPGVSEDRILFGLSAPFTGPTKELGRGIKLGIDARFAAQNEIGGVHGRRLELVEYDDGYEPRRTEENMRKLIDEDKVFCFVGNVGSPTSRAALPIALQHERLFFAPYSGARFLRGDPPNRYVFNYRAAYDDETSAIVTYLVKQRGVKPDEIAVFAQNDDYGDDGFEGVARALRKYERKRDEILRVGYERNSTNVTAAVEKIQKSGRSVKAVVMVATYLPAAEFIQQVRDRKMDVICTNISFVGSDSLAEKLRGLGPAYVKGVIVTQTVPPLKSDSTGVVRFRKDLAKFTRTERPSFVALEGYVAASILIDALERTGEELTTERLIDELEKTRELDLGIGTTVTFGLSKHQSTHKVWAIELDETDYRELELE